MATQFDLEPHRAVFERICSDSNTNRNLERNSDGSYSDATTQAAWWGYQEGLKAVLAQAKLRASNVPQAEWPEDHSLYGEYFGTNIGQSAH